MIKVVYARKGRRWILPPLGNKISNSPSRTQGGKRSTRRILTGRNNSSVTAGDHPTSHSALVASKGVPFFHTCVGQIHIDGGFTRKHPRHIEGIDRTNKRSENA